MSLIKRNEPPTEIERIQIANTQCLNVMKSTARSTFDLVWNNQNKTPQEICDMFGVDAVKAFDLHSKLQTLIYSIDNSWVPLVPPLERVENEDGTITIVTPPSEE